MFSLLHACSYIAAVTAFLFVTLSLASGLLYIAELVEEHSRLAKIIGQRTIYAVIILHILFCFFDSLPLHLTIFGIICHLVYLQNFSKTWPFISLTSIKFIASCLLVILDHFAWFFYFADRAKESSSALSRHSRQSAYRTGSSWDNRYNSNRFSGLRDLSFMDVATFFGVCVWLVPFFLFLSLSANDNVLPSLGGSGEQPPHIKTTSASDAGSPNPGLSIQPPSPYSSSAQRSSILKVALDPLLSLVPRIGGSKYRSSRSQRDGLIASPRSSAPPSPNPYGPPSPSTFGGPSPFSPPGTAGTYGDVYDSNTLSPQTPFSSRFTGQANPYTNNSPPTMLRQPPPPGPKRSMTSPAVSAGLPYSANQSARSTPTLEVGLQQSNALMPESGLIDGSAEEVGATIPRSVSPYGAPGASGLVSRRKGA